MIEGLEFYGNFELKTFVKLKDKILDISPCPHTPWSRLAFTSVSSFTEPLLYFLRSSKKRFHVPPMAINNEVILDLKLVKVSWPTKPCFYCTLGLFFVLYLLYTKDNRIPFPTIALNSTACSLLCVCSSKYFVNIGNLFQTYLLIYSALIIRMEIGFCFIFHSFCYLLKSYETRIDISSACLNLLKNIYIYIF